MDDDSRLSRADGVWSALFANLTYFIHICFSSPFLLFVIQISSDFHSRWWTFNLHFINIKLLLFLFFFCYLLCFAKNINTIVFLLSVIWLWRRCDMPTNNLLGNPFEFTIQFLIQISHMRKWCNKSKQGRAKIGRFRL